MILDKINSATGLVVGRSHSHSLALSGLLSDVLNQPEFYTQKYKSHFISMVWELTFEYMMDQYARITGASNELMMTGHAHGKQLQFSNDIDIELVIASDESTRAAYDKVDAQARFDAEAIIKKFSDISMQVVLLSRQKGWSTSASIIAVKSKMSADTRFRFLDRAGRSWDSTAYIKTVTRQHFLLTYNESYLFSASSRGTNKFKVVTKDIGHTNNGVKFLLAPTDEDAETYYDIRERVFHPNSNALVSTLSKSAVTGF